ncbi:MAG: DUF4330 domain-containing protein [Clostridiales bacterium]|nr:DUF4330 domain-containing protein [Clostridiales bacterium]
MNKRKLRFNGVDVLLILLALAAAFVLFKVFILNDRGGDIQAGTDTVKIQYVVQLQNLDARYQESVRRGQSVEDAITRKPIGTVVGVEVHDYEKVVFDYDTGREVVSRTEGKITMLVTIEADVVETDRAFLANGCDIRVGKQFSLMLPEIYGVGFCIRLDKE